LRTFAGDSLRPPLGFNPRPRRLSTPPLTPFNSTPTFARMERPGVDVFVTDSPVAPRETEEIPETRVRAQSERLLGVRRRERERRRSVRGRARLGGRAVRRRERRGRASRGGSHRRAHLRRRGETAFPHWFPYDRRLSRTLPFGFDARSGGPKPPAFRPTDRRARPPFNLISGTRA
jgi:hypothetical protein